LQIYQQQTNALCSGMLVGKGLQDELLYIQ